MSVIELQKRMVVEYGVELDGVWLPFALLRRLDEHGPWNVPFMEATADQAEVLIAHGLAARHNNGLCRGGALRNFVDALPFAPTESFETIPATGDDQADGSSPAASSIRKPGRDTGAPPQNL